MTTPQSPYELDKDRLTDLASVVFELYCSLEETPVETKIIRIDSSCNNWYQMSKVWVDNRSEEDLRDATISVLHYLIAQGLVTDFTQIGTTRSGELGPVHDITNIDVTVADRKVFSAYAQDVFKAAQPYFENSWRRFEDFIASDNKPSETPATFNAKNQQLIIGDLKIYIETDTDQYIFCKRLFPKGKPTKRPVQKAALFQAFGYYPSMTSSEREEASRKLYSVRTALNSKIQNQSNGKINKLFTPGDTFWIDQKYR